MSYYISWQILENKVRSPVGKKVDWVEGTFTFYFLSTTIHNNSSQNCIVSLTYPVYRLDWAFSVLQYCSIICVRFWKGLKMWPLFCPATSLRLWSILRGGAGKQWIKSCEDLPPAPSPLRPPSFAPHPWLGGGVAHWRTDWSGMWWMDGYHRSSKSPFVAIKIKQKENVLQIQFHLLMRFLQRCLSIGMDFVVKKMCTLPKIIICPLLCRL